MFSSTQQSSVVTYSLVSSMLSKFLFRRDYGPSSWQGAIKELLGHLKCLLVDRQKPEEDLFHSAFNSPARSGFTIDKSIWFKVWNVYISVRVLIYSCFSQQWRPKLCGASGRHKDGKLFDRFKNTKILPFCSWIQGSGPSSFTNPCPECSPDKCTRSFITDYTKISGKIFDLCYGASAIAFLFTDSLKNESRSWKTSSPDVFSVDTCLNVDNVWCSVM